MAEKLKELPAVFGELLKTGDILELKKQFSQCDPNAVGIFKSNIFSFVPMPREFAFWAKEQGADINFRDQYGKTPIFEVARRDGDILLMVELGADINAAAFDGRTPLHVAAARGNSKAVRALLKAGADIEAQTRDYSGYGHFTPLEKTLYEYDMGCTKKYDICKILLKHGAHKTERCRQFASALSETFYRHTLGKKPSKFLHNQEAAVKKLCEMFDAKVLRETSFHDGVSPIILTVVGGFKDNFKELWNFLVPPTGRAQTAQGEVIRIAGSVKNELWRNGGLNWDDDYRKMLDTFYEYLHLANPIGEPDQYVREIIDALRDGDLNDRMLWRLHYCALGWVENNPEVVPPLEAEIQWGLLNESK